MLQIMTHVIKNGYIQKKKIFLFKEGSKLELVILLYTRELFFFSLLFLTLTVTKNLSGYAANTNKTH